MKFTWNDRPATGEEVAKMVMIMAVKVTVFFIAAYFLSAVLKWFGWEKAIVMYLAYKYACGFKVEFTSSKEDDNG